MILAVIYRIDYLLAVWTAEGASYWLGSSPYKHTQRFFNIVMLDHHGWMEGWINDEHTVGLRGINSNCLF